jgi:hypothetical protein
VVLGRCLQGLLSALFPWTAPPGPAGREGGHEVDEVEVACCPSQLQVALVTAVGQEVGLPRPVLTPSSPGAGGGEGEGEGSSPVKRASPSPPESGPHPLPAAGDVLSLLDARARCLWEAPFVGRWPSCAAPVAAGAGEQPADGSVDPAVILLPFSVLLVGLACVGTTPFPGSQNQSGAPRTSCVCVRHMRVRPSTQPPHTTLLARRAYLCCACWRGLFHMLPSLIPPPPPLYAPHLPHSIHPSNRCIHDHCPALCRGGGVDGVGAGA